MSAIELSHSDPFPGRIAAGENTPKGSMLPLQTMVNPTTPDDTVSARGWLARLDLQFQHRNGGTLLTRRQHVGPLLVQKALYPEHPSSESALDAGPCHVYVIHPPGGVAGGDDLQLQVELESGAHALLTTPAAGKFYRRSIAGVARVAQTFRVHGAALEWLPQENIFYPNCAVELRSVVHLAGEARFIGWEIGCLGLPANELSEPVGARLS